MKHPYALFRVIHILVRSTPDSYVSLVPISGLTRYWIQGTLGFISMLLRVTGMNVYLLR